MLRICVSIVVVGIASCAPPPPPPVVCSLAAENCPCFGDADCGDPKFFRCDTINSVCRATCGASSECDQRPAEFAVPACSGPLGCWCDEGSCVAALCTTDSECGELACRNGQCVPPPELATVARCSVVPDLAVITPGAHVRFHVLASDAQGEPVIIPGGALWAAIGIIGQSKGQSIELEASVVPTPGPLVMVQAAFGSVSCEAKVLVLPIPVVGELLLAVVDEGSGRPIADATVVVSTPDGSLVQQGRTDSRGVATVTPSGASSTLSVFHADYSYQTIANHPGTGGTVFFALRRNPADRHGGYVGSFADVPLNSNVHLARVGFSSPGDGTLFELTDEAEPTVPTDNRLGSLGGSIDTPVPLGTFLGFADRTFKPTAAAFGVSGACADEAAVTAGTCGTQSAWALTADLPAGDFPPTDAFSTSLLPLLNGVENFKGFSSSVVRDVQFTLRPAPLAASGAPDFLDQSQFTQVSHHFTQVPLRFAFTVRLPVLPRYRDLFLDQAASAGVALVPGRGLVPLGVGVGTNRMPVDGELDRRFGLLRIGQLRLRMAPPHHGLEGLPTAVITQLLSSSWKSDATAGRASSTLVTRLPSALVFDPEGDRQVLDQASQGFPALPEARFNFSSDAHRGLAGRGFSADAVPGVSVLRVTFTDGLQSRWDVLVNPSDPRFILPAVPGTLRDRLFENGNGVSGRRSRLKVQALRFIDDAPWGFLQTVGSNASLRPLTALAAWSMVETREIKLTLQSAGALPQGGAVRLTIEGFRVGSERSDDGLLRLSFEGGLNCPPLLFGFAPPGQSDFSLPPQCSGRSVIVRAALLDPNALPLDPPVETSSTVSIQ